MDISPNEPKIRKPVSFNAGHGIIYDAKDMVVAAVAKPCYGEEIVAAVNGYREPETVDAESVSARG